MVPVESTANSGQVAHSGIAAAPTSVQITLGLGGKRGILMGGKGMDRLEITAGSPSNRAKQS